MSASLHEERGNGEEPFITRARVHDLVVMGRFPRMACRRICCNVFWSDAGARY
jgi:hypothetical protein